MKLLHIIFILLFCIISAQKKLALDSLQLKDTNDLFADDYGSIYLYKSKDFSFTKYDSLGKQKGKLMLTLPFKIQSVQNPLNIPLFSENTQEVKLFDQNLNEIQTINFRQKFWFIRMAYVEDLQQMWLLNESGKRLIQYNYRDDKIINSFALDFDFENILDLLVFENTMYILKNNQLLVYNFKSEKITEIPTEDARKLRRENENIMVVSKNAIYQLENKKLKNVFNSQNSQIVDKNSVAYYVCKSNKLYLYGIKPN